MQVGQWDIGEAGWGGNRHLVATRLTVELRRDLDVVSQEFVGNLNLGRAERRCVACGMGVARGNGSLARLHRAIDRSVGLPARRVRRRRVRENRKSRGTNPGETQASDERRAERGRLEGTHSPLPGCCVKGDEGTAQSTWRGWLDQVR